MKKLLPFLLVTLLFSCSSQHFIQKAQFEPAVAKSVKKIRKNWSNQKEIDNLKYAYSKANDIDQDRLIYLYESGEDNIWDEVHRRYLSLQNRQDMVKTLPNEVLQQINYTETNYAKKIAESKQNAAEYYYQKGLSLMEKQDKYLARDAYSNFLKAKGYYTNYKDVDTRIADAQYYGTNRVLFLMKNNANIALPEDFENELLKISLKELNQQWVNYDTKKNNDKHYDYYIQLSLKSIVVSPEDVRQKEYTDEKKIEDGFEYLLDARGNVSKDSLGNDIKIPVYKIITCKVMETAQYKEAIVSATLDYINTADGQLIKTHPIGATMVFDHQSAEAFGDMNALSSESLKKVKVAPLPFPSNPQMIMDAAVILKDNTKGLIYSNRNWLKN